MFKIEDIEKATGCMVKTSLEKDDIIDNVITDTRNAPKGKSLFVPIKGENFNGADFIDSYLDSGGSAALVTDDGYKALANLAWVHRSRFSVPVVGVTGSSGKTSTKEMIAAVLEKKFNTVKTKGNLNNEIGVPLTLFRIDKETEAVVVEMGMSNAGEMSRLSAIVRPNIAVITNIGTAHIGNFGSRDKILKAKLEILDYMQPNGIVVINADDELLFDLFGKLPYRTVAYGIDNALASVRANNLTGQKFEVDGFKVQVNIPGKHQIYNALAAICVGRELGVTMPDILSALSEITSEIVGRQTIKQFLGRTIIDDCYNANLDSVKASISVLAATETKGKRIAVLGDMLELGAFSEEFHRRIGEDARKAGVHTIITMGKAANLYMNADYKCESIDEVFNKILEVSNEGDTVLVKASHGLHFEELIQKMEGDAQ